MKIGSKQICSRSIYDGHRNLSQSVYKNTRETELFCQMLNYLFDCMNTRNLYEAKNNRNDALLPYTFKDDPRLEVYLDQ